VQLEGGQRGAQATPPRVFQRNDVEDSAVAGVIEGHRRRELVTIADRDLEVEGGVIGPAE